MRKKYGIYKVIAMGLACSVMLGSFPSATAFAAESSEDGKEEVVYIMTDANGETDSVNVVNIWSGGEVTDYGAYTEVKMLTTTDEINQTGDEITFDSDSDKVYYQGTMDADKTELPWNIDITYTLDGEELEPDALSGAKGALTIGIKITENKKCKSNFYDNYALQVTLTLDTNKCTDITADGATLANVGADKQISYTALPGKGLDAEITADVTDFEMDAIAINAVKLNLGIDIDDDELMDKVREIMDATSELSSGATDLMDGTKSLKDGGSSLEGGASSLQLGASSLDDGISSLSSGVAAMQSGLDALNSKSEGLTSGSSEIATALKKLQSSLSSVSVSTEQLKALTDSSSDIKTSIDSLSAGAAKLQSSISYDAYKSAMNQNGLDIDALAQSNADTIAALSSQISALQTSIDAIKAVPGYDSDEVSVSQVSALESQIATLSGVIQLLSGNSAAISGTESYLTALSDGASELTSGLSQLSDGYDDFNTAISQLAGSLSDMAVNMTALKDGVDQLVSSYEKLDTGINSYTGGVASVVAGYSQLASGTYSLSAGSRELLAGAGTLKDGASDLYSGISELYDGSATLCDGATEFSDKTSDMDTQVEDTIDEMISTISGDDSDAVSFASSKNKDVRSVQFVIKTSAIEIPENSAEEAVTEEDKTFWEKLKDLF